MERACRPKSPKDRHNRVNISQAGQHNAGGGGAVESAASDGGEAGGGAEGDGAAVARRLPRVHDSFVLDTEYAPISDHAPIGCVVLLPPPASEE